MSTRGPENRSDETIARQAGLLEQVREILFGSLQRDLERRLARADAQLGMRAGELEQEIRRRTELLEDHLREEVEALAARMQKQQDLAGEALGNVARESRSAAATLEQRIGRLEEALGRAQRELRQQILEQTKTFLDELHRIRAELGSLVERELGLYREEEPAAEPHGAEPPPTAH